MCTYNSLNFSIKCCTISNRCLVSLSFTLLCVEAAQKLNFLYITFPSSNCREFLGDLELTLSVCACVRVVVDHKCRAWAKTPSIRSIEYLLLFVSLSCFSLFSRFEITHDSSLAVCKKVKIFSISSHNSSFGIIEWKRSHRTWRMSKLIFDSARSFFIVFDHHLARPYMAIETSCWQHFLSVIFLMCIIFMCVKKLPNILRRWSKTVVDVNNQIVLETCMFFHRKTHNKISRAREEIRVKWNNWKEDPALPRIWMDMETTVASYLRIDISIFPYPNASCSMSSVC